MNLFTAFRIECRHPAKMGGREHALTFANWIAKTRFDKSSV